MRPRPSGLAGADASFHTESVAAGPGFLTPSRGTALPHAEPGAIDLPPHKVSN
jgi:hypothetical protein